MKHPLSNHPVFDDDILDGVQLLEADAGTGKTWTIAGLFVRAIVERELDIGQVLVVTFTNAATAELAERIRERIAELERVLDDRLERRDVRRDPAPEPFCVAYAHRLDDVQARSARSSLRIALARIDEMAVQTIHGYCQRVIDEHALSIGVARGLPIRTGADPRVAQRVAQWWRSEVLDAPPERLALVALAGLTPEDLRDAVAAIVAHPLATVEPVAADWRSIAARLETACAALVDAMGAERQVLHDWLAVKGNVDGRKFSSKHVALWFEQLRTFCGDRFAQQIPEAVARFATARFSKQPPPTSIPACCDALLELHDDLRRVRGWIAQEIAEELRAGRSADLADAAALGFDDLLRLVHDALADAAGGAALADALRERHPVALIDECQDTDALQWEIVRRVYVDVRDVRKPLREPGVGHSGAGALVLVGDPKQAIYAFRGADVHSYLQARKAASTVHSLRENQRSSLALIESVNALFERPNAFLVEEIEFRGAGFGARRRPVLDGDASDARAPFTVVTLEPDPAQGTLGAVDASRQAVQASVAEIARLLASGATYDGRALRPGDIAVLVNSHRQGARIKRALAAAGIGAAEISRDSVLDTLECGELLRVIAAIAEPADPTRLRSALTTTLFGADAASLAAVERDAPQSLAIATHFAQARDTWEDFGPIAALRPLLDAHGTGARLGALRDGDRRLTNLMHLIELLADDDASFRSPRYALHAWSRLRAGGGRDPETGELRLESDENLVRIVTVHKSKGLEFPIVFLPFAWSAQGARKTPLPSTRHEREADGGWRAVLDFDPDDASVRAAVRERYAENLRTFYVALTRARQRCYLFWGAASTAHHAALAWLLHGRDPPTPGTKSAAIDADAIAPALADWCGRANRRQPGAMIVIDTPTLMAGSAPMPKAGATTAEGAPATNAGASALAGEDAPDQDLGVRAWTTRIAAPLTTTSFSTIAATIATGDSAIAWRSADFVERPDHDQQPPLDETAPGAAAGVPEPAAARFGVRFEFPAGAQAGVCLHGILEESPFDSPPSSDVVARWLARCGFARMPAADVADWLAQVIAAPLPDAQGRTIELASIPAARQLREMDFHLSGHKVSDRAVLDAVATEFGIETTNVASRWSGFLRGFVDLVFEHRGRYYIVDWKSNHLGDTVAHYGREALETSMRAHAYPLQASLYTLALHRWLRRTLHGYDYERHFGGVFYVFLRGAGLEATGVAHPGIHASRPSRRLVATLDRIFAAVPRGGETR